MRKSQGNITDSQNQTKYTNQTGKRHSTCISIFSKIGLVDLSKPCTQVYLQIFANCIDLQLAIRISKNHTFRTCTTPSRTFRPILSSIGLLGNELPRKEIISTDDRRTDGQTDGRTDRRRARQQ